MKIPSCNEKPNGDFECKNVPQERLMSDENCRPIAGSETPDWVKVAERFPSAIKGYLYSVSGDSRSEESSRRDAEYNLRRDAVAFKKGIRIRGEITITQSSDGSESTVVKSAEEIRGRISISPTHYYTEICTPPGGKERIRTHILGPLPELTEPK